MRFYVATLCWEGLSSGCWRTERESSNIADVGRTIDLYGRHEIDVTDAIRKCQCMVTSMVIIESSPM